MSLRHHPLHEGSLLRIACVCCTPDHAGCGALEHAGRDSLALPLRGVFVKHHEGGAEVVAHAGQALFFNLYLQEVLNLTPFQAAWWMLPQMSVMMLAANLGPAIVRRHGRERVVVGMLAVMAAGFTMYAFISTDQRGLGCLADADHRLHDR